LLLETIKTGVLASFFEQARVLDETDPLKSFRSRFAIPQWGSPTVYFTGNSLGLMPLEAKTLMAEELEDWAKWGVEGHFKARRPWFSYHTLFSEPLAGIAGAHPSEVVAMGQLTANLHFLLASFYQPEGKRTKIICEANAFPSDLYALKSHLRWHGLDPANHLIAIQPVAGNYWIDTEALLSEIEKQGDALALVMLGGVNYLSGQALPMATITAAAHRVGAKVGFDLAHAMGNIPLYLHDWDVDFAAWCSYKYLNSGPGSVAGIFVHERHHNSGDLPRLEGWWGNEAQTRFLMRDTLVPAPGAEAWQLSNAPVFSMAPHLASLRLFQEAGVDQRLEKTQKMVAFFLAMLQSLQSQGLKAHSITPDDFPNRGCQTSIVIDRGGKEAFDRLTAKGVVADWREPNVIRVAPVPLYNRYEEICCFFEALLQVLV
jgi:kynureninase